MKKLLVLLFIMSTISCMEVDQKEESDIETFTSEIQTKRIKVIERTVIGRSYSAFIIEVDGVEYLGQSSGGIIKLE